MSLTQLETAQAPNASGQEATEAISDEQKTLREQVNNKIYSFPDEAWQNDEATLDLGQFINSAFQEIELSAHLRLPTGSSDCTDKKPDGFIYEDIYAVLEKLLKNSYLRGKGLDECGEYIKTSDDG